MEVQYVSNKINFDIEKLFSVISPFSFFTKETCSDQVKEILENIADKYQLSPKEMSNVVLASFDDYGLNEEELEKFARDLYELKNNPLSHGIVDRKERYIAEEEEPQSKEDKLIDYFQTTSPRQFLTDLSNGAKPSINDLIIIEDILFNQRLSPGVVNVLLYFVMIKSDFQLNRNYIEKIANHWARKNIKTAKEAMDFCKKQNRHNSNLNNQKKGSYQKSHQKVPRGKLLNLFLLDSTHHQLTRLTQLLGHQRDEETIAHLLNEAYQKYNR
jgi:replication initiation and membrane attachment protein